MQFNTIWLSHLEIEQIAEFHDIWRCLMCLCPILLILDYLLLPNAFIVKYINIKMSWNNIKYIKTMVVATHLLRDFSINLISFDNQTKKKLLSESNFSARIICLKVFFPIQLRYLFAWIRTESRCHSMKMLTFSLFNWRVSVVSFICSVIKWRYLCTHLNCQLLCAARVVSLRYFHFNRSRGLFVRDYFIAYGL